MLQRRAQRQVGTVHVVEPEPRQSENDEVAQLIARFQSGDQTAFPEIYKRYFDRVFAYLRLLLNNSPEAEDLTQDVFIEVLRDLPRYKVGEAPFAGWLFQVVRNDALNHLRKTKRLETHEPDEIERRREANGEHFTPDLLARLSDKDLLLFIERIPISQRQVLLLRYMLDLSVNDTAAILGRTPLAVRQLQHRAFATLRKRLEPLNRKPKTFTRPQPSHRLRQPQNVLRSRRFALDP